MAPTWFSHALQQQLDTIQPQPKQTTACVPAIPRHGDVDMVVWGAKLTSKTKYYDLRLERQKVELALVTNMQEQCELMDDEHDRRKKDKAILTSLKLFAAVVTDIRDTVREIKADLSS